MDKVRADRSIRRTPLLQGGNIGAEPIRSTRALSYKGSMLPLQGSRVCSIQTGATKF